MSIQILVILLIFQTISARSFYDDLNRHYASPLENRPYEDINTLVIQKGWPARNKRDLYVNKNSNGYDIKAGGNMYEDETRTLSGTGSLTGLRPGEYGYKSLDASLDYSNINGNSASFGASHLPNLGDELSAKGTLNLFNNDNHNLDLQGSFSRTFPSSNDIPDFNSYGGSLDYTYKNQVGGSLGFDHSDLFDKTDYSAAANLNIFRDKDSSLDFSAGMSKSESSYPQFNSDWSPYVGLGYRWNF